MGRLYLVVHLVVHQPPPPPLDVDASLILLLSLLDIHLQDMNLGPMELTKLECVLPG